MTFSLSSFGRIRLSVAICVAVSAILGGGCAPIGTTGGADEQEVEVVSEGSYSFTETEGFTMIADTSSALRVATLKMTALHSGKATLYDTFEGLAETANELGANSYRLVSEPCTDVATPCDVVVNTYRLSEKKLEDAQPPLPQNIVYLVGKLSRDSSEVEINDVDTQMPLVGHLVIQIAPGETVKIQKGGLLGPTLRVKGRAGRLADFITFGGPQLGPSRTGDIGISVTTGSVDNLPEEVGRFLVATTQGTTWTADAPEDGAPEDGAPNEDAAEGETTDETQSSASN
jgi:hypothetical protein